MEALIVIDPQNEFSPQGAYPASGYERAIDEIKRAVTRARTDDEPIFWIRHENTDRNGRFEPGSWGADLDPSLAALVGDDPVLTKTVFGAFSGTALGSLLEQQHIDAVRIVGLLTHMCVSTTAREALMHGLKTTIQANACTSRPIDDPRLGHVEAAEAHRIALLHLASMGASIE
jgi:nicotinamidase-related amidase